MEETCLISLSLLRSVSEASSFLERPCVIKQRALALENGRRFGARKPLKHAIVSPTSTVDPVSHRRFFQGRVHMKRIRDTIASFLATAALAFFALAMLAFTGAPAYATIPNNTGCKSCSAHCTIRIANSLHCCIPLPPFTGTGISCVPTGRVYTRTVTFPNTPSRNQYKGSGPLCQISGGENSTVRCKCRFWGGTNGHTWCSCSKATGATFCY